MTTTLDYPLYVISYDARGAWAVQDAAGRLLDAHPALQAKTSRDIILHPRRQQCQERIETPAAAIERAKHLADEYSRVDG